MLRKAGLIVLLLSPAAWPASPTVDFLFPRFTNLPFAPGDGCCGLVSGDFNRDGKLDLVVASASRVTLLLGQGDGTFLAKDVPGAVASDPLFAADIRGIGVLDLIVGGMLYLGHGDGTFEKGISVGPVRAIADLNRDGKLDLVVYGGGRGVVGVRLGHADGTFDPFKQVATTYDADVGAIVVGDINGDGKLDLVTSVTRSHGYTQTWLGNGDGTFQEGPPIGYLEAVGTLALGDLNHDGKLDVIWTARFAKFGASLFLGNGDGTFQAAINFEVGPSAPYGAEYDGPAIISDFNGDGLPDIALGFTIYLGDGKGGFAVHKFGQLQTPTIVGDFNGDGRPDLVGISPMPQRVEVLLNSAVPTSSIPVILAAGGLTSVAPGSLASGYGSDPSPTTGSGVKVHIFDASGIDHFARLLYVSPSLINFQVPGEVSLGDAIVNVENPASTRVMGARSVWVQSVAAAIFTMDGTANGPPAGYAIRVAPDGTQTPLPIVHCASAGSCAAVPIDLSVPGAVFLVLYGTGFGGKTPTCRFTTTKAYVYVTPTYAGPETLVPGLDQINLRLPASLPSGPIPLQCGFPTVNILIE
jgi:uncharacterized protein (TIGR03437 family)